MIGARSILYNNYKTRQEFKLSKNTLGSSTSFKKVCILKKMKQIFWGNITLNTVNYQSWYVHTDWS